MAMTIRDQFVDHTIETDVFRLPDREQEHWAKAFDLAGEYYPSIMEVPAVTIEDMSQYDVMVICSPTYFGNVSAEVKAFMDDMACYYLNRKMSGKIMIACASASTAMGGGDMALQAISIFAQHMGMIPHPVNTLTMPAYGLLHIAGEESQHRVGDTTLIKDAARDLAQTLTQ